MPRKTIVFFTAIITTMVLVLFALDAWAAGSAESAEPGRQLIELLLPFVDQMIYWLIGAGLSAALWLLRRITGMAIDRTRQQQWHDAVHRAALLSIEWGEELALDYLRRTMPGTIAAAQIDSTAAPPAEVINDRNGEVANLFRILQRHYPQFVDTLRFQLSGRREFDRLKASDPATLTDLERAARFLYLQRLAFGGKVAGQNFGVDPRSAAGFNLTRLEPQLAEVHERLAGVTIECLDWLAFIDRYDREETLFYLDPPYFGSEGDYGRELFSRDQFEVMALRLSRLRGRWILSINDVPEIRALFAGFTIDAVTLRYSVGGGKGTAARELIISGGRGGFEAVSKRG